MTTPADHDKRCPAACDTSVKCNCGAQAATKQVGDVVAYLDVGAGGYLDLGTDLADEALSRLPKGRHALVIAGTYGIDGYVAAPQPSPTAQAAPAAGAVAGSDDLSGTLRRLDSKELAAWVDRGMALSENLAMYVQADCTLRESQARDMLRAHLFSAQPAPAAPTSPAKAADSVPAVEREQERIAFKDAHRHLELDEVPDAWGRPMFKHSHVETSWLGWIARAARKQGGAVIPAGPVGKRPVGKGLV